MPQLDLIFNRDDHLALVGEVLSLGFSFLPDREFDSPIPEVLNDASEVIAESRASPHLFLIHEQFTESPISLSNDLKPDKWRVQQRRGGPALDYVMHDVADNNGARTLPPSFIGYYATYRSTKSGDMVPILPGVQALYRKLAAFVKHRSRSIGTTRKFYLGNSAAIDIHNGIAVSIVGLKDLEL